MKKMAGWVRANGTAFWRVSVILGLVWIALEIHWLRHEMPTLPWNFDSTLDDIEQSLSQISERIGRLR